MARITVNINQKLNNKLLKISKEHNESLSQIIKQFIEIGIYELENSNKNNNNHESIESHCHQLAIQSNALLRKISMKLLDLSSDDLEMFKLVSKKKYQQILEKTP